MASNNRNSYLVDQMLTDIHLEIYQTLFGKLEYKTVLDCAQLNHETLQEMGVSLTGHRKRILKKIQEELEEKCGNLKNFNNENQMTSILSADEHEDGTMLGEEDIGTDSELYNLPKEYRATVAVNHGMHNKTGDETSAILEHNWQEKSSESSGESCDEKLDYTEQLDSENFFEFRGPMIENELYKEMNIDDTKKTHMKAGPTRSFILRNRPVPDLPVSARTISYNISTEGTTAIVSYSGGKLTQSLQKEQSGDENFSPILPYEETFFFRDSEHTKEDAGDTFLFSSNSDVSGSVASNTSNQPSSEKNTDLSLQGSSEESIYSTLEENNIHLGLKILSTEETQRRSFQDTMLQNVDLSHLQSTTQNPNSLPCPGEVSITPYACFYESYNTSNKAGWLDKLSPHSSRMFQKRWVKVDGHHLSYYHNDKDVFSRGKILLSAVLKTQKLGDNKFEVAMSQKTLVFRAEKEGHRDAWIRTLQDALRNQAGRSPLLSTGDKSGYLELRGYKTKIFTVVNGRKLWLSKSKQNLFCFCHPLLLSYSGTHKVSGA